MGCFGCSLASSTVTAVVVGLVESILGMAWNILVIVVIKMPKEGDVSTEMPTTVFEAPEVESLITSSTTSPFTNASNETTWVRFITTLTTDESLEKQHIFEVTVTALVLNSLWLITTLALAVGNVEKCRDMLKPWIFTTVVITIMDTATTVYFIFKAVADAPQIDVLDDAVPGNLFILFAILFSRGGPIIWFMNIALCIFVAQRIKEIAVLKKKRFPFDSDVHITPYTLHHPYEAYEADSAHSAKHMRPHTPPPDYEAHGNGYRKGRRPSFPSDYETMTLPVSMRSSRSSTGQRPPSRSSYLYDDRVELQHRTSAAAETVVNHAYENKGLEVEPEGWMGIPRPTLKITR